jgi:hypothetical protein
MIVPASPGRPGHSIPGTAERGTVMSVGSSFERAGRERTAPALDAAVALGCTAAAGEDGTLELSSMGRLTLHCFLREEPWRLK